MSYISPYIQSQFDSLSANLKNTILSRDVSLNNMSDLINILEVIVDEEESGNTGEDTTSLPMRALSEIPTPKADAQEITALVKKSGKITGYQLSNGTIVDKEQGVAMAKQGEIRGVGISSRKGSEYLKSLPDNNENNNLTNLPTVSSTFRP